MIKKQKTIVLTVILAVLFAGLVAGAYFGYRKLSGKYDPSGGGSANGTEQYKDFSMTDRDGNTVKLSDFTGQPVVINFWAQWCGPCKSELPHFDKLAKEYDGRVKFLMVNIFYDGKKEKTLDFVSQNGYTFPLYFDDADSAVSAYGISSVPETIFISSDGKITAKRVGAMSESTIRKYLTQLLREKTE